MTEYKIQIGTEVRDMTADEIVQRDKDLAESKETVKAQAAKAAAKTSAQTKLAALGLTADEIAAL